MQRENERKLTETYEEIKVLQVEKRKMETQHQEEFRRQKNQLQNMHNYEKQKLESRVEVLQEENKVLLKTKEEAVIKLIKFQ